MPDKRDWEPGSNVGDRLDGQGRPSGSALVPLVAAWFARGLAVGGVSGHRVGIAHWNPI